MSGAGASTQGGDEKPPLPNYERAQFDLPNPEECDMVMKGGITSGIVYPYAILEIATKYRLRSIGGTSAGAIAAAFAAAAEYGRRNGRPESFLTLKRYADELPEKLLSLFQPRAELQPVVDRAKAMVERSQPLRQRVKENGAAHEAGAIMDRVKRFCIRRCTWPALLLGLLAGGGAWWFEPRIYPTALAVLCGLLLGAFLGAVSLLFRVNRFYRWGRDQIADPLMGVWRDLPNQNFGFCTGKTQVEGMPALTDWIYHALQDIAFGDPDHRVPLTFGDLSKAERGPPIELRMVTTNLSMRRPHTLPKLGIIAGFDPVEWDKLFPAPVMAYLRGPGTIDWRRLRGTRQFPKEDKLPVIVGVRMSLSFPLLFTAVPLQVKDLELASLMKNLAGKDYPTIRPAHFSDGGISSNFPIHMFDSWLPSRPTFAFSLNELPETLDKSARRIILPETASDGIGVPVEQIGDLPSFGWQILNSAKDWQDQLLSELTGHRERIVRIFLAKDEGGLSLDMKPEVSQQLMYLGYLAGRKFVEDPKGVAPDPDGGEGAFDFEEHKWRRMLALYRHLDENLDALETVWTGGFGDWFQTYEPRSYKAFADKDRVLMAGRINALLAARQTPPGAIAGPDRKFPRKIGVLKVGPRY